MDTIYQYQIGETRRRASQMSLIDLQREIVTQRLIFGNSGHYSETSRNQAGIRATLFNQELARRLEV